MITTQHDGGQISFYRPVAIWVPTITTTPKDIILIRITAGRIAKYISDYRSAGAWKRGEHERAQARGHNADLKVQRDVGGRGADIVAGVICVQGQGNFSAASISHSSRAKQCPRNEEKNKHSGLAQNRKQRFTDRDQKTQRGLVTCFI